MVRVSTGLWAGAVGLGVIAAAAIGVRAQGLVTINLLRFASHSRLLTWPNWRRRKRGMKAAVPLPGIRFSAYQPEQARGSEMPRYRPDFADTRVGSMVGL